MGDDDLTRLIEEARLNRPGAADRLMERVYSTLKQLAHRRKLQPPVFDTTTLVHEAYLRMVGEDATLDFASRAHFFFFAARAMRNISIDQARKLRRQKHGGTMRRVEMSPHICSVQDQADEALALDEALGKLKSVSARAEQVVELRFYAGLQHAEAAEVLGVSEATVRRDWDFAKAFLYKELGDRWQDSLTG